MEKNKRENRVLSGAAELFDLPADLVEGLPHVEMVGGGHFFMEHHRGILSYSGEAIDINGGKLIIRLAGQDLELTAMNDSELRVRGRIRSVELVR